ncbi:unnamed protein product [Ilex paraguariensis]|uniref:Uncharacterized protein n=1 Tax=Ilex paraguariensis TaxID=185542 RepID=A0ABC8RW70_9AQUA
MRGSLMKMSEIIGDAIVGLQNKSGSDMARSTSDALARLEALGDTMPQGVANRRGKTSDASSKLGDTNGVT